MKNLRLLAGYALCLTLVAGAGCRPKPKVIGEQSVEQAPSSPVISSVVEQAHSSLSPTPTSQTKSGQTPSLDLSRLEKSVRPSVIWVSVFDPSGKLLRTETGFFISDDARFITTAHAVKDGINAVAKTADGGIHNVSGVLAASTTLDLAILKADLEQAPFLTLNDSLLLPVGTRVGIVGSGLAGNEGAPREATITAQESDRLEIAAGISASSVGSPVVDANGEVVGVVTSAGENVTVQPSSTVDSLLSQIASDAKARWPQTAEASPARGTTAETSPSPQPTAKLRLVYAPAPSFPPKASRSGAFGSGRFRLTFDASGNASSIEMLQSTGNALYDQAANETLRQWRSAPGREGVVTVPITFEAR